MFKFKDSHKRCFNLIYDNLIKKKIHKMTSSKNTMFTKIDTLLMH